MTEPKLIDGKAIELGGSQYVIPPLSFRQLRKHGDDIKAIRALKQSGEDFDVMELLRFTPLIHAALTRNYPDMTLDQVEDLFSLGDTQGKLNDAISAVFATSTFARKEAAEGEVAAVK